jgi:exopolysaccharide biosynthesis polyprenyl glycosylphosphotransferase
VGDVDPSPDAPPAPRPHPPRRSHLRIGLVLLDAVALAVGWGLVLLAFARPLTLQRLATIPLAAAVGVALLGGLRLYRARECAIRSVEMVGLGKAVVATGLVMKAAEAPLSLDLHADEAISAAVVSGLLLLMARSGYRSFVAAGRRQGRYTRPVVVVGTNEEGADLVKLLRTTPELGYDVVGVLGGAPEPSAFGDVAWLGPAHETVHAAEAVGANGAFLAASALPHAQLNTLARQLLDAGVHVQLSSGIRGIAAKRVRHQPMAHELLFYLEPLALARWQRVVKRGIDVVMASILLVVTAPVLGLAAVAIRLHDGGPVLFRQERVGKGDEPFTLIKLRTMVRDAEDLLTELQDRNQRDEGPLFKLTADPRVTRVGRWLRATSIDELPQLVNVLRGEMSIVGPRPALASEVALFDERLRIRHQVLPGVTGLWQVEARDDPGFGAYRRLDLFYVENWSVGLDLAIILRTGLAVVCRTVRALRPDGGEVRAAA